MNKILGAIMMGIITLSFAQTAAAATYYVATTGNDANAGTITAPFRSIAQGLTVLSAGSTLYIRGGTYNEKIDSNSQTIPVGTSWTNPVTIASYPGETAIIFGMGSINLAANYVQYMIFDRIVFDGNSFMGGNPNAPGGSLISLWGGANHIRIQNGEIKNSSGQGITIYPGNGYQSPYNEIINNKIHHNGTMVGYDHGLYAGYAPGVPNTIIRGNEFYANVGAGIQIYGASTDAGTGIVITKNNVHDNDTGISLWDVTNAVVSNNLFYNNTNAGMSVNRAPGAQILNNTISGNLEYEGIYLTNSSNVSIKNNIIHNNASPGIRDEGSGTIKSNNLCNSGCDVNANPLFVGSANFALQSTSPAINAGVNLSPAVVDDYSGVSRPQGTAYDIGAYEYGGTVPSTLQGDINNDRIVNSLDWSLMSAKWLTSDTNADLNKDGAVNSLDWSIMSSNWLKTI